MTCADPKDWPSETRENVDCAFRTALAIFLALYFLEVGINSDPPTGNLPVGFLAVRALSSNQVSGVCSTA